ncbi:MAG: flagellin [Actinomycetota bacterium]|nr:flagellin [Actinomycetota bacterium]
MGLRVNTNVAAMNAYRNLSATDGQMSKSLEKLSSGLRINRAADDAAGLAISEGLRSQIGGLKVAVRNTQDGISVVQTAEGALTETHSILQRMRDLSVQASSGGSLNDDAKAKIQSEISELTSELTRIADTTQFNGTKLLDGSYDGKFQVGANVGEAISVKIGTSTSANGLKVDNVDVTAAVAANASTAATTQGTATVNESVAITGSSLTEPLNGTLDWEGKKFDVGSVNWASLDAAGVTAAAKAGTGDADVTAAYDATTNKLTITNGAVGDIATSFTQASGADSAIRSIDNAIGTVSTVRADLGAKQNRFDHTINNLNVAVENLSASESRIRDADMAQEMVQFTRNQILSQAGTAMLAQANQASQGVLSLLR